MNTPPYVDRLPRPALLRGCGDDPKIRIDARVATLLAGQAHPRVLEAGCGSTHRVALPAGRYLVGIDTAQRQLDNHPALDEKHLGDLQTYRFPGEGFDLILCWEVIEHLPEPMHALARMTAKLNGDGSLVLAFPNLWSLKGLVTKFTPHKLHEWCYRHVIGDTRISTEWAQADTPLRLCISPGALRRWARRQGLEIVYDEVYEGPVQSGLRRNSESVNIGFGLLSFVSNVLSLGRLDLRLSDCVMILRKPMARIGS